jgi:hypothetical protein
VVYLAFQVAVSQLSLPVVDLGFHLFTGGVRKHVTGMVIVHATSAPIEQDH